MGLEPPHTLLDVGCGPLRAGMHFIRYLRKGNYTGVDNHWGFILTAEYLVKTHELVNKRHDIRFLNNFNFQSLGRTYDFILEFSLLNHCAPEDRELFFSNIHEVMHPGTRLFITHCGSFQEKSNGKLHVKNCFFAPEEISDSLNMTGWGKGHIVFPIIEYTMEI